MFLLHIAAIFPLITGAELPIYNIDHIEIGNDMTRPVFTQKNGQFCLKKAQVKKFLDAAPGMRERLMAMLCYYQGLRREECATLRVEEVDLDAQTLTVQGKGGTSRVLPLHPEIRVNLKYWIGAKKYGWIFPARKTDGPIDIKMLNHIFRKMGEDAGIKNPNPKLKYINPHILRHSIARHLKDAGVPLDYVQQFLGHADYSMTASIYGLPSTRDVADKYREVFG